MSKRFIVLIFCLKTVCHSQFISKDFNVWNISVIQVDEAAEEFEENFENEMSKGLTGYTVYYFSMWG